MTACLEVQALKGTVYWPGSSIFLQYIPAWVHGSLCPEGRGLQKDSRELLMLLLSLRHCSVSYKVNDTVEYYKVLWIERRNGIAYRRACD
jgi:hypothetical protein